MNSEIMKTAYDTYQKTLKVKYPTVFVTEYDALSDGFKAAWEASIKEAIEKWIDTDLQEATNNRKYFLEHFFRPFRLFMRTMRLAPDQNEATQRAAVRTTLGFLRGVISPECIVPRDSCGQEVTSPSPECTVITIQVPTEIWQQFFSKTN